MCKSLLLLDEDETAATAPQILRPVDTTPTLQEDRLGSAGHLRGLLGILWELVRVTTPLALSQTRETSQILDRDPAFLLALIHRGPYRYGPKRVRSVFAVIVNRSRAYPVPVWSRSFHQSNLPTRGAKEVRTLSSPSGLEPSNLSLRVV
jgi:hypothetical protein